MSVRVYVRVEFDQPDGQMILERNGKLGGDDPLYDAQKTEELIDRCTESIIKQITPGHSDVREIDNSLSAFVRRDRGL